MILTTETVSFDVDKPPTCILRNLLKLSPLWASTPVVVHDLIHLGCSRKQAHYAGVAHIIHGLFWNLLQHGTEILFLRPGIGLNDFTFVASLSERTPGRTCSKYREALILTILLTFIFLRSIQIYLLLHTKMFYLGPAFPNIWCSLFSFLWLSGSEQWLPLSACLHSCDIVFKSITGSSIVITVLTSIHFFC